MATPADLPPIPPLPSWQRRWLWPAAAWTAVIALALGWSLVLNQRALEAESLSFAHAALDRDEAFRDWGASHGGVYVPRTAHTPSNPFLEVPEREVTTASGRTLTLVNPAYMLRQLQKDASHRLGAHTRLTSLHPIHPGNRPDPWETAALERFERNRGELHEFVQEQGVPYLRVMRPLVVTPSCLTCHAQHGFKVSDLRGGLSISLPLAPFLASARQQRASLLFSFSALWLLGLGALAWWIRRDHALAAQLRTSEAKYRTFFDHGPDGIVVLDPERMQIVEFNDQACRQLGYTRDEFRHLSLKDLDVLESPEESSQRIRKVMAEGYDDFITTHRTKQGDLRTIHVTAQYFASTSGPIYHCVWRDITERQRAEAEVQKARQLNELIIQSAQEGIVVYDPELRHQVWNPFMEQLSGLPAQQVLGRPLLEVFPFLATTGLVERLQETLRGGGVEPMDLPFRVSQSGRSGWTANTFTPFRNVRGEITGALVTVGDITERKRAELALLESEQRLRALFEQATDGIVMISAEGQILDVNEAFARMHGYPPEEMRGMTLSQIDTPETVRLAPERLSRMLGGEPLSVELDQVRKDGSVYTVEATASVVTLNGRPVILSFHRDISDRKRAEQEQARLQAQLLQSQKMESLGTLAGGIAHDMNNVLGAILGLASANLETQPPGSAGHQAFDLIAKAATRGGTLVRNLLTFARKRQTEQQVVDLNPLLEQLAGLLAATTLAKVQVVLDLAPGLPCMRGDAGALSNALMNLCVNAVDAMAGSGTLTLRTRPADPGWLEVVVEDTGIGMPPEVLQRAPEPFFTTKAVGKGTGLGLTLVYTTVQAHQGRLDLHSEPGRGTRVSLRFPACTEPDLVHDPDPKVPAEPLPRGLTVLLVDDDELIQTSGQALLQALGHDVRTCASGEEALAALDSAPQPDVVILDMNMPGLGGAETLPRLRQLAPELPVLLSTGRADQAALDLAQAHPAVTLLSKPYSLGDLRQALAPFQRPCPPRSAPTGR